LTAIESRYGDETTIAIPCPLAVESARYVDRVTMPENTHEIVDIDEREQIVVLARNA
jgi:hypothetical protein